MSIIVQRKRISPSDLKIKLLVFFKKINIILDQMFPANTPGDYNSPLESNRAIRWVKRLDQKNKMYALIGALAISPVGWYSLGANPDSIFPWFFIVWGGLGILYLISRSDNHNEKLSKEISQLKNEIEEMKKQIRKLQSSK